MSYAADEPWIWDLLSVAGTPAKAADLEPATVDAILRQHRIRRVGTAEVFDILRGRALYLSPGTSESISERVNMLIPLLRLVNEQKKTAAKKLKALLEAAITDPEHPEHQTARILQS